MKTNNLAILTVLAVLAYLAFKKKTVAAAAPQPASVNVSVPASPTVAAAPSAATSSTDMSTITTALNQSNAVLNSILGAVSPEPPVVAPTTPTPSPSPAPPPPPPLSPANTSVVPPASRGTAL